MRAPTFALVLALFLLPLTAPVPVAAQLVGLKTVPLAAGEQFMIFPSLTLGMGGASIALDDALADPFVNPAKGAWTEGTRFFSVPTFYSVSNDNGGARTMPVGLQLGSKRWFGGGMVALQDLDMGSALVNPLPRFEPGDAAGLPRSDALAIRTTTNRFAHISLGRRLGDDWAVAASLMYAGLRGTDGVEQLFADAWDIEEHGRVGDYRIGVTGRLPGERTVELVLVRNLYQMAHDVTSVTWELTDSAQWTFSPDIQDETHKNISNTWGAHLGYVQPLEAPGWRVGGILTVNRKDHPKIPTYDLEAVRIAERPPIPRDPGNSWAFDIGAGLVYEEGPTTFAVDVVYQPAVSDTWADELEDVVAADGSVIPAGGHTVDNHFVFDNAHAGLGLNRELGERWALQLGVRVRSYSYHMEQVDHLTGVERDLTQQWTEWTPTWGAAFQAGRLELRYTGLASSASHFPSPGWPSWGTEEWGVADEGGGDILAPPSGRVATPDETVVTHRIQLSVPIG